MRFLDNKIPPPIVAAIFAALMWQLATWLPLPLKLSHVMSISLVAVLIGLGCMLCLASLVAFYRAKTTVNPHQVDKASSLISSGVFNYSRNPIYLGFAFFLLAWASYLNSIPSLAGLCGFVLYMNRFQIMPEEKALTNLFGDDFEQYKSRVRRWL